MQFVNIVTVECASGSEGAICYQFLRQLVAGTKTCWLCEIFYAQEGPQSENYWHNQCYLT